MKFINFMGRQAFIRATLAELTETFQNQEQMSLNQAESGERQLKDPE